MEFILKHYYSYKKHDEKIHYQLNWDSLSSNPGIKWQDIYEYSELPWQVDALLRKQFLD